MPGASLNIFISYSRTDSAFVDRLEADLLARGHRPWVDRRRIDGGQDWMEELQRAIDRSHLCLVVISPEAMNSKYVKREYRYADHQGRLIIPLNYRPAKAPLGLDDLQWINFQASYDQGLRDLLASLSRLDPAAIAAGTRMGAAPGQAPPQPGSQPQARPQAAGSSPYAPPPAGSSPYAPPPAGSAPYAAPVYAPPPPPPPQFAANPQQAFQQQPRPLGNWAPAAPARISTKANVAMWLGICFIGLWFTSVPAIIVGHIALNEINRSGGRLGGKKQAQIGLWLGYILTFLWIVGYINAQSRGLL